MVCSCCAYDCIAMDIKSGAKIMRDLVIKFYRFPQMVFILQWVNISDHHCLLIVSSHHTWLQSVVDVHRHQTSAPAPSLP